MTADEPAVESARYQSDHFTLISFDSDTRYLADLSACLERHYERITSDLDAAPPTKTQVVIYPDLASFHDAIGWPGAPDWVVGTARDDTVYMVSPYGAKVHSYEEMLKVLVHEFVHIVTNHAGTAARAVPRWLSEGVALFEADQSSTMPDVKVYPTLSELDTNDSERFAGMAGYALSFHIVQYIVGNFGFGKLRQLLADPKEFETILGFSHSAFHKQWICSLMGS